MSEESNRVHQLVLVRIEEVNHCVAITRGLTLSCSEYALIRATCQRGKAYLRLDEDGLRAGTCALYDDLIVQGVCYHTS